jgi:hypothetical protein
MLDGVRQPPLEGRLQTVTALAFSPDGRPLAVGGDNGGLQLWDMPTGEPIGGLLTTPGEAVNTFVFDPDGTTPYAGSAPVPLQRYDLDPAHALSRVCARAGGAGPSRAQWHTYTTDAPYRRVCRAASDKGPPRGREADATDAETCTPEKGSSPGRLAPWPSRTSAMASPGW